MFHGSLRLACLIYVSWGLAITKKKIFIEDETFKCIFYKIKYIINYHINTRGPGGSMSQVVGYNNSYKHITNTVFLSGYSGFLHH